jgi:tripartite-type tricarboxylate transporter receptor subunit TctC
MAPTRLSWMAIASLSIGIIAVPLAAAQAQQVTGQERPIRLIVGMPPGGVLDTIARTLAQGLEQRLARPVVVENRTGATGNIAVEALARAAPDGDTLGAINASAVVVSPHVYRRLPVNPQVDLTPIANFAAFTMMLVAANDYPPRNLRELADALRTHPAACGTAGAGSLPHVTLMLLARELGAACTPVHYRGETLAFPDLLSGRLQLLADGLPNLIPAARDGRVQPLFVSSARRSPLMPEVPTAAETFPGFQVDAWVALMGPRGLPDPLRNRFETAAIETAREPAVVARLRNYGVEPVGATASQLTETIRSQDASWGPLLRAAGVTAD